MACAFAHGAKEQLYHPHFYKTSPCNEFNCQKGPFCSFTHGAVDTRGPAPAPMTPEENSAQAKQEARLEWAEATLLEHQPLYGSPPRYHVLEEKMVTARRGSGAQKRWSGNGAQGAGGGGSPGRRGSWRRPGQQADRRMPTTHRDAKRETEQQALEQAYFWQMASVYTDLQESSPEPQLPMGFTAPVLWTQQASPDGCVQGSPASFVTTMASDASASPVSDPVVVANGWGTPMGAVPMGYSFGLPGAGVWSDKNGLLSTDFAQGSQSRRAKKGQAIRTPDSFASLGSPRESITPTGTPATPCLTPRPGEEAPASSSSSECLPQVTSSIVSAHTSGTKRRAHSEPKLASSPKAPLHMEAHTNSTSGASSLGSASAEPLV